MTERRAVITAYDGTTREAKIGVNATITSAIRDLYPDFDVLIFGFEIGGEKRDILKIGDDLVEKHLKKDIKLLVKDDYTGVSIKFI